MVQFRKSPRGSWAYLLVSKTSTTPNFPTVNTKRSEVCDPVEPSVDFLDLATEVDGLAQERPVHTRVGIIRTDLVRLAARESRNAYRSAQSKALIEFWIDPGFGALPEPDARIQGYV